MAAATHGFWSGRQGLGRHFWLYFILPIVVLTGVADALDVSGWAASNPAGATVNAVLFTAAALAAIVAAVPLFISIVRSTKGLVWKLLVAVVTLLVISAVIRQTYDKISRV